MSTHNTSLNSNSTLLNSTLLNSVLSGDFNSAQNAFQRLYTIITILRSEQGCPWDKEQTPLSMRQDLIEETFEAVDAISEEDAAHTKEELGDLMLNATMISYMHEQSGQFSVADVFNELSEKLIRRHPHVFPSSEGKVCAESSVKTGDQVLNQWDKIKENVEGRKTECILDEVPGGFPPLLKSFKLQKKAAKKGFDWDNIEEVKAKITEELNEVENAAEERNLILKNQDAQPFERKSTAAADAAQKSLEEEIGDLLFAVVNYARHLGVHPDVALSRTNEKFYRRFSYVQKKMNECNEEMAPGKLTLMDTFWNEAKKLEHN